MPHRDEEPTGPPKDRPQGREELGLADTAAFILAALSHVLPYVLIPIVLFAAILLVVRLAG